MDFYTSIAPARAMAICLACPIARAVPAPAAPCCLPQNWKLRIAQKPTIGSNIRTKYWHFEQAFFLGKILAVWYTQSLDRSRTRQVE